MYEEMKRKRQEANYGEKGREVYIKTNQEVKSCIEPLYVSLHEQDKEVKCNKTEIMGDTIGGGGGSIGSVLQRCGLGV